MQRLVRSIREYYPQISIIIADDSPASLINESEIVHQLEKDENIRYFKLPENNGWNSGRALLISQVETEYFVSLDDDWIFNNATKIDEMLQIIEDSGFDIIGGGLGEPLVVDSKKSSFNNWLNHGKYHVQKGNNGHCLKREYGFYGHGFRKTIALGFGKIKNGIFRG